MTPCQFCHEREADWHLTWKDAIDPEYDGWTDRDTCDKCLGYLTENGTVAQTAVEHATKTRLELWQEVIV